MSDDFNDAELASLESSNQQIGIFFRMATDPVIRLWLGLGKIKPGVNVLDPSDGGQYLGLGEIENIPSYKQLLNGAAERVDFIMSGVSGETLQLASVDTDSVIGKRIDLGFMLFGQNWQPLGPVHWHANYIGGPLSVRWQKSDDPTQAAVRTLSLSAGSTFTSRRRPSFAYWTDPDQQARVPGDEFCSLAAQYTIEFNLPWPVYT